MTEPQFSDAELVKLREAAEDTFEWQNAMEPIIKAGTYGQVPCPACQGVLKWSRNGRDFNMLCDDCGWNGCGSFGSITN